MNATFDNVLQDALRLPIEERSRIAARLIESVDTDEDADLSPAWNEEIERRVEAARIGRSQRIPHDAVMGDVREMLAKVHPSST